MGQEVKFLILFLFLQTAAALKNESCLNGPEVNPKRFVTTKGVPIPLTLGVTNRITHKLATHVFMIFLKEILGYDTVVIKNVTHDNITAIFEGLSSNNQGPHYMIDLEVWITPNLNTIHYTERFAVSECGILAPPGRYGWFIPKKFIPPDKQNVSIYWNSFKDKNVIKKMYSAEIEKLIEEMKGDLCEVYCDYSKIYYVPKWCKDGMDCPLILAQDYESTSFVINDIADNKLFARVIWLGKHFFKYVDQIMNNNYYINKIVPIILTYTPSELMLDDDFVSVSFPACNYYIFDHCNYGNKRLVKLSWSSLVKAARPAFESLQNIDFSARNYKEMIAIYVKKWKEKGEDLNDDELRSVACDWMKNNTHIVKRWKPEDDKKNTLYIGGIFPLTGSAPFFDTVRGIVVGATMAIKAINNNTRVLQDYKLELLLDNGECKADIVMRTFINYIFNNNYPQLVGILGPACSDTVEPLAGIAKHFHTLIISYSAEGSSFSDREKYPYFYRTIGENKQYMYVYLKLLSRLQWKRLASLTEDGTRYTEYVSMTENLLQSEGISFVVNRKFPQDWDTSTMQQCLEEFKEKNARIIIADVNEKAARTVMCLAFKNNMTAEHGYVWFLPHRQTDHWFTSVKDVNCNVKQMIKAIDGHFSLSHAFFAPDNNTMQENITVKEWKKKYELELTLNSTKEKNIKGFSNYAGYTYDAIWAYAYALDGLTKQNHSSVASLHSPNTTKQFVKFLQKTNFSGVSGHIQFSNGSSKFIPINIMQWLGNKSRIIGTFEPKIDNDTADYSAGNLTLYENQITWLYPDGKPPDGMQIEPPCFVAGFAKMLNTECHVAIVIANIIGIGILILILIVCFLIIKHRYDKKVRLTQKYMESLGIDLLSVGPIPSLDTWEISKEKVVINRKLGEGAFGTVYGGEAYFNEKGWVAVAVKTLKVGSTTEEKLDFLSEAEVMKRFEHKNIVQLLGVCTKSEPVYTIMEFMLYGDLKTFLLARRHLVNEKFSDDSDEISSKKLTNMALDIARALSYLAELRYVHRDVASRNCLINAQRVVKLGDFGMTRPMFESDYYKFNRKGMLPVRWMAPESLVLGVFTPASDVWSFGVLLFEIITFGSFPFQGLTNNQVLEHVKQGNTINIPAGIKPQLDCLIKSCWEKDRKKRPHASEIVEFLANNPRLLVPCIDVPISSVQMDDTAQLELPLPQDKMRRFSMTLRQRTPSSPTSDIGLRTDLAQPLLPTPARFRPTINSSISEENNIQIDSPL
ncbi:receptor-type guanylate cyclase gcy-19-like [Cimex lectularius]|uniref:receptor protein-tyrosine kinase n=1 Tax=Cimex lectularius TaxID=79782 RepID=A0A8I6RXJ6_CIMLE|nr:receptor-type guanylate cyclase gcy-19-like [Cimex lectularius]XP_014251649.1 receptor-type guanylate cyclase gcy-19-like [Cimex lectularius]XP_014251650.1 receptor-type guanylate cyclase gcy-19-like [Cimex lectularius]XP_024082719.1 receptor-type guanylate cyclase gcy-19-like [Cimex lectularius]XP_024082720.1 receptor-type guanylate cyclase gcy-19-like [Cimex lectularius]XP_024082721.1 receptor-type guanylate cyclase gcy-19-like [Cimex lectularius]XP_024082722.1 receptor-type guanylate cy